MTVWRLASALTSSVNVYEVTEECARVIDPDGSFCLDNSPTAFGGLPCHASQVKASAAAPCHTNLQTVSYFGSFARLNPGRHHLQFVPGSGAPGNHTVAEGRSGNKEVRYRQSAAWLAVCC